MSFDIREKRTEKLKPIAGIGLGEEKKELEIADVCKKKTAAKNNSCTDKLPSAVNGVLERLLKGDTDMFESAETLRILMLNENYTLQQTSELVGIPLKQLCDKLSLLDFTPRERRYVKTLGFSECTAVAFAALEPKTRLCAFRHCRENKYDSRLALHYAKELLKAEKRKEAETESKNAPESKMSIKGIVRDAGLLINSLDRALGEAKKFGMNITKTQIPTPDGVKVVIDVANPRKK